MTPTFKKQLSDINLIGSIQWARRCLLKVVAICHYSKSLITTGYKTQEDIQALEEKIFALQKEKEDLELSNSNLLSHFFELRSRVELAEKKLEEVVSDIKDAKTRVEEDKAEAEKEIESLKAKVAHIKDSWTKSFDQSFKNIMEQVHVICKDHNFFEVNLFRHEVDGGILDMPLVNLPENNPGNAWLSFSHFVSTCYYFIVVMLASFCKTLTYKKLSI